MARDKTVFPYAYDKVSRVEIETAGGKVTLERDGITWKITAPEALKADTGAVNGLLWRIRDLRGSGFLDESAAGIPRYLSKPDVTVRIWEEGSKEPKTLLLGLSGAVRAGEVTGVAAPAGTGPVVIVEAKDVRDLAKTATDLRDKNVVGSFDMKEVKRVREERAEHSDFSDFHRRYYEHLNNLGLTADEVVDIAKALTAHQKA